MVLHFGEMEEQHEQHCNAAKCLNADQLFTVHKVFLERNCGENISRLLLPICRLP